MKELSKAKRHAIYLKATKGYPPKPKKGNSNTTPYCLCYNFARIIQKVQNPATHMYRDLTTMLPEFGMFNPQKSYSFERWWHSEVTLERDGQVGLQVRAQPKSYGPPFLNLGLDLNNIDASNFAVNLRGRVTTYDWVGAGSEVRIDGALGTEQSIFGEIYRPLGRSKLFVAPRGYYTRYPVNGYVDDRLVAEYRFTKAGGGVDVGYVSGRRAELRLGVDLADVKGRVSVGLPGFREADGTQKFARLRFAWDGQTSPLVPTRGLHQIAELRYYWDAPGATSTAGSVDTNDGALPHSGRRDIIA